MSVIRTDEWLLKWYDEPLKICEKLKTQFDGADPVDICRHLNLHGMYHLPLKRKKELVNKLQENNVWEVVKSEKQKLEEAWVGPDIPIFIFPSDQCSRELRKNHNGRSGLSFEDKLFLFVSEENTEKEIKALLTHEYNHVCWLSKLQKKEEEYVLLDAVILEGLAENAVRERFGEEHTANWTTYYSMKEWLKLWKTLVFPNRETPTFSREYLDILYGLRSYPKMAGYCVGYHLVKEYMQENNLSSQSLLHAKTNVFKDIKSSKV